MSSSVVSTVEIVSETRWFVGGWHVCPGARSGGVLRGWGEEFDVTENCQHGYWYMRGIITTTHVRLYEKGFVLHQRTNNVEEDFQNLTIGFRWRAVLESIDDTFADPFDEVGQ